jgi:CDP-glucose 4,6-dehydratase
LWLQEKGVNVIGYSLPPPTRPSLFEVACISEGMTSIIGDVRDLDRIRDVISEHHPEIVFHMAAQSLVRHSYADPVETYTSNVMGTVNILEAVRHSDNVRVLVNITSDKCYENNEWCWGYRESDPMGGHDPYSSSKGCAELITAAYRRSYFCNENNPTPRVSIATARAGNVIGGGDWATDRLIPDIIKAVLANQPVVIRYPNAIRPWQHVFEPLRGYLLLAERMWEDGASFAEAWNFGPSNEDVKPVSWIAGRLTSLWGGDARWEIDSDQHPHEANYLKLDCSKANTLLGWSPKLDLRTALELIVEWYRAYQRGKDMREVIEAQIERYENLTRE